MMHVRAGERISADMPEALSEATVGRRLRHAIRLLPLDADVLLVWPPSNVSWGWDLVICNEAERSPRQQPAGRRRHTCGRLAATGRAIRI